MAVVELIDLSDAMEIAVKVDVDACSPRERLDALSILGRLDAQLMALRARVVGAFDGRRDWAGYGYPSPACGVRERAGVPMPVARRWVGEGRALNAMPLVAQALADGEISPAHAQRLRLSAKRPQFADHGEALLLDHAQTLGWRDWLTAVETWEQYADDENADPTAPPDPDEPLDHGELTIAKTLDGPGEIRGSLDPIGFEAVETALHHLEQEIFRADWKRLVDQHGTNATPSMLGTKASRRARALVEMANRAMTAPKNGKRPRPLIVIHTDPDTFEQALARLVGADAPDPLGTAFRCELDSGTVIGPDDMMRLALAGEVRRLVYTSKSHILDYGTAVRLFTGAIRDAIVHAHRTCAADGCDVRASRCEIDHIQPAAHHGPTSTANGRPLCRTHHRHRTRTDPG